MKRKHLLLKSVISAAAIAAALLLIRYFSLDKINFVVSGYEEYLYSSLPEKGILQRYFELGGRRVTFSSDAHRAGDICSNYSLAASVALEIGFTHWTVYKKHTPHDVEIKLN